MRYKYTLLLLGIGAALSLLHYVWHQNDAVYLLFYALSVPAWIYPFFGVMNVNPFLLYLLTIASWALIGYIIDRFAASRSKAR